MSLRNRDGIDTYIVKELPNGKVEVGFDNCNITKAYTRKAYLNGETSDYVKVPSDKDFVQYHTGERRRMSNGNIGRIIGGTGRTLVVEDEITGVKVKTSYKEFYGGDIFGTKTAKTVEQVVKEERERRNEHKKENAYSLKYLFLHNGTWVLEYGNHIKGRIPCIKIDEDKYRIYSLDNKREEVVTLSDMTKILNRLRTNKAHWFYDSNFFVGEKLKLAPFDIPCAILRSSSDERAVVKLDGTDLVCKVDMSQPVINLFSVKRVDKNLQQSNGSCYKESSDGVLFRHTAEGDHPKSAILIRDVKYNPKVKDYQLTVTYKVTKTNGKTKTDKIKLSEFYDYFCEVYDKIKYLNE